ncbi:hypothetical protein ACFPYI_01790 [Halomarina salina]|uniref:Uncharacterized protein n=1 Tax=Halomarina salina TaxID=1872699 RepID=A0ABD5RI83_9EURY|nr:hypothetical protein [Halomarina salina]
MNATIHSDENPVASLRIPSLGVAKEAATQGVRARVEYRSRRTGTLQDVEGEIVAIHASSTAWKGQYSLDVATDDGRTIIVHAGLREVHSATDQCMTRLGRLTVIEPAASEGEN